MRKFYSFMSTMCVVLLMAATSHGQIAGSIVAAQSITSTAADFGGNFGLISAINQDGLSATYTSGVTDFNSFVASTTHASNIGSNSGFPSTGGPAVFTFDLGSAIAVDALAFWQGPLGTGGATGGTLFADNDADFSNGTAATLGSFSATGAGATNAIVADVFTFTGGAVTTQFVHLDVSVSDLSVETGFANIGEIAFRTETVPEPSSALLLSLAGLFAVRRRR